MTKERKYWRLKPTPQEWFKNKISKGEYKDAVKIFMWKLPNYTYPGGLEAYIELWEKHGDLEPRILLWRSMWHFVGGAALAAVPVALGLPYGLTAGAIALLFAYKEHKSNEGTFAKQATDVSAWAIGAYFGGMGLHNLLNLIN